MTKIKIPHIISAMIICVALTGCQDPPVPNGDVSSIASTSETQISTSVVTESTTAAESSTVETTVTVLNVNSETAETTTREVVIIDSTDAYGNMVETEPETTAISTTKIEYSRDEFGNYEVP